MPGIGSLCIVMAPRRIHGTWSTVGSSNIDHLSLVRNCELIAVISDADFARRGDVSRGLRPIA